ncbi:hypothetical protein Poly51_19270 [Rubripirellula tenax]|uniref:Ice-binding protein C-terminal domain-containing protein n=1 Tax=Rubripirellula tenax TaxID=2528015 RepID=A0A5C6FHQ4_9BACT|nr:PEP-CTERM sorting domain-containing protein [Rubripirellula tenax]TWU59141.1 hypothetical protein Poly51_19270 [Rubripirellula tenax]
MVGHSFQATRAVIAIAVVCSISLHARADLVSVALLGADSPTNVDAVRNNLLATGNFSTIDDFAVASSTPTLAYLNQYDAVLVWSNSYFQGFGTPLGNVLDDYIDGGGGVVAAPFSYSQSWRINGDFRFKNGGYYALEDNGGSESMTPNATLDAYDALHPVMQGVSSFANGTSSFLTSTTPNANATVIASLSSGDPLVAERTINGVSRIDLAFFPLSDTGLSGSWDPGTDGNLILANSLVYVARATAVPEPTSLSLFGIGILVLLGTQLKRRYPGFRFA